MNVTKLQPASKGNEFSWNHPPHSIGPVDSSGGPPHDSDMEKLIARVDSMEKRFDRLETRLDGMDTRLRSVEGSISAVSAKLDVIVAKLPSWWQAPVSAAGLLTTVVVLISIAKSLHFIN